MFDLGWTELLLIGIVALIVVGPKDLPVLFRNVGRFVGKAKGMAREFSSAMHDAAEESGMRDVAKGLKAATNPVSSAMDGVKEATRDLTDGLNPAKLDGKKYDPNSATGKLAAERAEKAKKIEAATARAAADRLTREAAEAQAKAAEMEAAAAASSTPDGKT
ncbi:Sec-independent protein translocase protein TatB [Sedimentitalea sp. JM2-8]|uniref:Sec-independent protein translocase protein TatB n=1 Tax=Sedimentitalea xiamensis TaxID=3050037 RepID=A0ABT7FAD4_9RHOB|nr:Sec-independent protein translocase protein TatB [Sedimentitalea xiamensis]MDK3071930.1 Sec-independent protein translocase protein TatB [Sedimentitalea xiamensis]